MADDFLWDVFIAYSPADGTVARGVATRLRNSGLRVWLDVSEIKRGATFEATTEEGLERSRVLVLCMSGQTFGPDWARLEAYSLRFRDPLNIDRDFIPLRLDDIPIPDSLAQFASLTWWLSGREEEYL
jgi:hypothetical protein